jgi:hypothetical protein
VSSDQHRVYLSDADFERLDQLADAVAELGAVRPDRKEIVGALIRAQAVEVAAAKRMGSDTWAEDTRDAIVGWRVDRIERGLPCR